MMDNTDKATNKAKNKADAPGRDEKAKASKRNGRASAEDGYLVLDWNEWATKKVPRRERIISPFLPEKGLAELYSIRGLGKTFLALAMAIAVATGTPLLMWTIPRPRRVLYVDGEMPFPDLQERANWLMAALPTPPQPGFLKLFSADLQEHGIPDLANKMDGQGRKAIEDALKLGTPEQADLLILDNLSVLTSSGTESSDQDWQPLQDWFLKLRRRGVSVIFIHHAGKSGQQRGTTKREDPLDTVLKLQKVSGKNNKGATVEVIYEKHRGFYGDDAKSFRAQLVERHDAGEWEIILTPNEAVAALREEGLSARKIADKLGMSKSTAWRKGKEKTVQ